MRKHFLLFLLMTLLPLAGWAEDVITLAPGDDESRVYDGTAPNITVKAGETPLVGTWAATDGGELAEGVPTKNAGVYTWTETAQENPRTATFTIIKKQVVYFLTGSTYAIGDKPEVKNHYSLATGSAFIVGEKLEDYAEFEFATSGNDKLDLDNNGRFTTITTYNIKALRVVEKNVHQNYDFRFTSTAAIVVTAKSIANFVFDAVDNQKYTGSKIEPVAPAIYASAEDKAAEIALPASNYDVTYVPVSEANQNRDNINVAKGGVIVYTGKGNYEGTLEVPFTIIPRPLNSVTVGSVAPQTYNFGTPIEPALTVTGKGDDNKDYPLTLTTDYTVNYNYTNENVSADGATGTLSAADGSNFTFPNDATKVGKAKFVIEPKSLADNDIAIDAIAAQEYNGNAKTPAGAIKWTIGETANIITEFVDFTYENNTAVGKATIIAKPKANVNPQNYKDQKTSTFDIIPTAFGEGVTIAFKKNEGTAQEPNWQNATYSYVGRVIKPGTIEADGVLEVKDGNNVLKAGEDYEIVSYGDATHDNTNAGNGKGLVTIKGIGNYGKISDLGDPITKSQEFNIAKATVTYTAADVTTTFGVSPADKFSATNDVLDGESIGGKLTYTTVEVNNGTTANADWQAYEGALTALEVGKEYRYKATWAKKSDAVAPTPLPDGKTADDYDTKAQIDARANYDTENIVYEWGYITVNNAKWIIVPDDQEKKYGVADAALNFTYKVYAGDENDKQTWVLVNNATFDHNPIIGRPANIGTTPNNGEDVLEGGYKIAVTNQTGDNKVQKAGYEIVCMTGTLNIVPFEITLTANDQTIYFGDKPNTETTDESFVKNGAEDGTKLTVTFAPVMLANGTLIKRTGDGSLGLKLVWDENGAIGEHAGALVPSVTNPNFKVVEANITKGKVTVLQNNAITLWDGDENVLDLINSYNTKTVNVSIKIDQRDRELGGKARTWAAGQWNTMTLPFDITVKELSQILGYAVVNVVDEGGYTTNEKGAPVYKFNLTMKGGYGKDVLPANKPFVVKTTDALAQIVNNQSIINFGSRMIVAPTDDDFKGVAAGGGSTFKPAYDKTDVTKADNGKIWFELGNSKNWAYIKSDSEAKWNIVPFEGFIDQNNTTAENPEAAIFVMEEIDGTTTVINGVEVDDINSLQNANAEGWYTLQGVKLESAPTEKGIYIFNGKKVAVQ